MCGALIVRWLWNEFFLIIEDIRVVLNTTLKKQSRKSQIQPEPCSFSVKILHRYYDIIDRSHLVVAKLYIRSNEVVTSPVRGSKHVLIVVMVRWV